jgi:hypothetical protein
MPAEVTNNGVDFSTSSIVTFEYLIVDVLHVEPDNGSSP